MIIRLFTDIEERLKSVRLVDGSYIYGRPERDANAKMPGEPAITHFGLWNENTIRLTQMRPFVPPAVFVEFYPVTWSEAGRSMVHADIILRLHIITATLAQTDTPYRDQALARFRLIRAIKAAFVDFGGEADADGRSYSRFQYYGSTTDHNHEQTCEDIEEWRLHFYDASAVVAEESRYTTADIDLSLNIEEPPAEK